MPPVAMSISRLLRQQAQSTTTRAFLRQPLLQQKHTIISQQFSQLSRRTVQSRPAIHARKPINRQFPSQQQPRQKRFSSSTSTNSEAQQKQHAQSFSQRMKNLSREYGWSAVGVYFALSALDFPFCFAAVRLFGVERIGHYEHVVVEEAKILFYSVMPFERSTIEGEPDAAPKEKITDEGASIWTQLAIAYAVHKSFIFFRVPLTAAVTPKVVKTLRSWGWNIGKKTPKAAK
ncbi:peptide alpha-N-acetyltransferase Nat2, putative [Talaromyces stipitatus ATCC 10500]|uniref:Peptide alpha-N-acetyltransferase Nat2, putative n=1 Tax=Talaromyces stipitatus (strain ATCC 10500 / CBS 375.48 / QM 6759 / NRRL 1006) TaxID=441959 RepID=B8LTQ7_TALSN|nr:peptide alpha-N-acetyltransferase Nat2, putative [Talaromyces stipitatus ATCC 10500]EED23649.1 peptide alpha-N-acetyltransferase Nat2, putative [Talaromyces stipitatus ATCC 10500]